MACSISKVSYSILHKNLTNKSRTLDYQQFNRLKDIANQGYEVYYATNHIIYFNELLQSATSNTLLNEIPFLNIANVDNGHISVSFTKNSQYFVLCSEPKHIDFLKWKQIISLIIEKKKTSISEDVNKLEDVILLFEKDNDVSKFNGFQADIEKLSAVSDNMRLTVKAVIVSQYLRKYFNLFWYRIYLKPKCFHF